MNFIKFKGKIYPKFQAKGNAAQFIIPFAKKFCVGKGYDIGTGKKEWAFPKAIIIDLLINEKYDANNLPKKKVDYIFSSHCLEHLDSWVKTVKYWTKKLKHGGVLFLYLPDYSQEYWRPWFNRKHKHIINQNHLEDLMKELKYKYIFKGGIDLCNSYVIVGIK